MGSETHCMTFGCPRLKIGIVKQLWWIRNRHDCFTMPVFRLGQPKIMQCVSGLRLDSIRALGKTLTKKKMPSKHHKSVPCDFCSWPETVICDWAGFYINTLAVFTKDLMTNNLTGRWLLIAIWANIYKYIQKYDYIIVLFLKKCIFKKNA